MLTRNERTFACSGNWSHGVSNDLVSWFLVEDALDSGPKDSAFPDVGPVRAATNLPPAPLGCYVTDRCCAQCDGSFSFPDLGAAPYDGSTPLVVYDAACGVPLNPNGEGRLGVSDDVDRLEIARPADPTDA